MCTFKKQNKEKVLIYTIKKLISLLGMYLYIIMVQNVSSTTTLEQFDFNIKIFNFTNYTTSVTKILKYSVRKTGWHVVQNAYSTRTFILPSNIKHFYTLI